MLTPLVIVWLAVVQDRSASPAAADLAAAKALYASGAYEEALTRLPTSGDAGASADEANEYRALCALALGRTAEAQRSLEELITRRPLFKMSDAEVSPRLVTMFHDVRKRLLPSIVRDLYAKGKSDYEQKQYASASARLTDLLALLADDDMAAQSATLGDLKILGEGFLKLSDAELAAAAKAAPPPPAAAPAPAPAASTAHVYAEADKDVVPPVEIKRTFPTWRPADPMAQRLPHQGLLRIVIDEQGKVETATLVRSVSEAYDTLLIAATRDWQFRPATKNGQPVKYQKLIAVTLSPR